MVHGFTTAFWVGAGVMAAGAVMVLLLIRPQRAAGALVCDGLTHVYEQALPSFELFTGRPAPRDVMRAAVREP